MVNEKGPDRTLLKLTSEVVAAYAAKNHVPENVFLELIKSVHDTMVGLQDDGGLMQHNTPAVKISKSITSEYLVCLECGEKFKSLKRHLRTAHGLSPTQYRKKWSLPPDYPMTSGGYSRKRSDLAFETGLGKHRAGSLRKS